MNNAVSGALDRLHYEKDPCVRYDNARKVWIYLHRGRTEEDFGQFWWCLFFAHHIHVNIFFGKFVIDNPLG